jgi:hypothetical protein
MLVIASLSWHIICWQKKAFQAYQMFAKANLHCTYHMLAKESLPDISYDGKRKPSGHIKCWQQQAFLEYHILAKQILEKARIPGISYVGNSKPSWYINCW